MSRKAGNLKLIFELQRHPGYMKLIYKSEYQGLLNGDKVTKWGHSVVGTIGSTCNIRRITRKGPVKKKHRSETYEHQKLNQKGKQGSGIGT